MERVHWWLLVFLMPAAMPLAAQEQPVETAPNSHVDTGAFLLELYLQLEDESKPSENPKADLESAAPIQQVPLIQIEQENSQPAKPVAHANDSLQSWDLPTESRLMKKPQSSRTLPGGDRPSTLFDASRTKPEPAEQESVDSGWERDPLDIFLEAYDALAKDVESGPLPRADVEVGREPVRELSIDTRPDQQADTVVPEQFPTKWDPQLLAPLEDRSNIVARESATAELEGSIETLPLADDIEAVVETGSPDRDQPIIVTGDLPTVYFPVEPLVRPMVAAGPPGEPTASPDVDRKSIEQELVSEEPLDSADHQPIVVTGDLPTIYFPIEPLIRPLVAVDRTSAPAAQPDFALGSIEQEPVPRETMISTDQVELASGWKIELPSPAAADWLAPVVSSDGNAAGCVQAGWDQPEAIGAESTESRGTSKTFFDVELKQQGNRCDRCVNGGQSWYGLRCPEVYYTVFGGSTSVTDLVDTTLLFNIETESTYTFGDAFTAGVAVGQIRGRHLRTEVEFAFRSNDAESLNLMQPGNSSSYQLSGEINSFAGMANAYWEFVEFPTKHVKPYIGAGLGFSLFDSDLTFLGEEILNDTFETDSAFAYQAMAGVNWCTGPNLSLFLEYRYFATDSIRYDVEELINQLVYKTDNVFVGVRFKF